MPDARQYLCVVALDLHAPTAPVAKLAPSQFVVDDYLIDRQSRGQSLNDRDQRSSVRLSGCCETKHFFDDSNFNHQGTKSQSLCLRVFVVKDVPSAENPVWVESCFQRSHLAQLLVVVKEVEIVAFEFSHAVLRGERAAD